MNILSSPECTKNSKLVDLSDNLDKCFDGSEDKILANGEEGLKSLAALSYRYNHIKDSLKYCERIQNPRGYKNCAEGKVNMKIC